MRTKEEGQEKIKCIKDGIKKGKGSGGGLGGRGSISKEDKRAGLDFQVGSSEFTKFVD